MWRRKNILNKTHKFGCINRFRKNKSKYVTAAAWDDQSWRWNLNIELLFCPKNVTFSARIITFIIFWTTKCLNICYLSFVLWSPGLTTAKIQYMSENWISSHIVMDHWSRSLDLFFLALLLFSFKACRAGLYHVQKQCWRILSIYSVQLSPGVFNLETQVRFWDWMWNTMSNQVNDIRCHVNIWKGLSSQT